MEKYHSLRKKRFFALADFIFEKQVIKQNQLDVTDV